MYLLAVDVGTGMIWSSPLARPVSRLLSLRPTKRYAFVMSCKDEWTERRVANTNMRQNSA